MDSTPRFSPDGLDVDEIERLLTEAQTLWARSPRPTSALLDGSAARRRERRQARRAVALMLRALPAPPLAPDTAEAA
jgi:hypothetical protein